MKIVKHKATGTYTLSGLTGVDMDNLIMGACAASASSARYGDMPESGRYDRLYKALQIARNTALAPVGARYLPWGRSMTVKSDDWDDRDAYTVVDKAVKVAVEC